jgi:hypothetical protein
MFNPVDFRTRKDFLSRTLCNLVPCLFMLQNYDDALRFAKLDHRLSPEVASYKNLGT